MEPVGVPLDVAIDERVTVEACVAERESLGDVVDEREPVCV